MNRLALPRKRGHLPAKATYWPTAIGSKLEMWLATSRTPPVRGMNPLWTRGRALLDQVVAVLRARTLYVSGALNMLDHPDLSDVATVRRLLHAFEEKARLIDLLSRVAQERGVQIVIGAENPLEEMREVSLVASTYSYRDEVLGVLGVVGPRRMAYSDVISIVDETARLVSSSLSRVRPELYLPS